ncbi:MAG: hypothetical protein QOK05_1228 [Chloroflexota bacterium]|jgi:surface antigen|nr:hypothetical protein [Chloroflexota bacterium]
MQLLGSIDVEVRDGFVVAARDMEGDTWTATRRSSMPRLLTHGLVMAAVAVPFMITAASAHPANVPGRAADRAMILTVAANDRSDRALMAEAAAARATATPAAPVPPPAPPRPFAERPPVSGGGGHFSFGWCTWYVSTRRYVPWMGNAIEWYRNAAAMGFAEGSSPRQGAIMVTRESGYGHVAYVESVDGDGRGWTVSEMNFRGFGVVSTRHIKAGQVPLVGFIY